jgi:hypothetical protein
MNFIIISINNSILEVNNILGTFKDKIKFYIFFSFNLMVFQFSFLF